MENFIFCAVKYAERGTYFDTIFSKVADWSLHFYQKRLHRSFFPNKFREIFQKIYSIKAAQKVKLSIKVPLSGLTHFLTTESPLKMRENAFYITLKALFILKIFNFCLGFSVI